MGEACCKHVDPDDPEEEDDPYGQYGIPVLQVNCARPRPKQRAKRYQHSPDLGNFRLACTPVKTERFCFGFAPGETVASGGGGVEARRLESWMPKPPAWANIRGGKPDFTGQWLCTGTDGDMEALMLALGVGWAKRTAAQCMSYGVGRASRHIQQNGNEFEIKVLGTPTEFVQHFFVGRGSQHTEGPEGDACVMPKWEHNYVLSVVQSESDGSPPNTWQQYLDGKEMVVRMIAHTGESASWRFSRQ